MLPIRKAATLLVLAALLPACQRSGDLVIQPEHDQSWGFDSGLDEWSAGSSDVGTATVRVDTTTAVASRGEGSLRIDLQGAAPPAKVWVQRAFAGDTLRAYEVTIEYDLGSTETDTDAPWHLVAGAGGSLGGAQMVTRGATEGVAGGDLHWVHRTHTFQATSGSDGDIVVGVGIAPASVGDRTYWIDDLRVTLLRQ